MRHNTMSKNKKKQNIIYETQYYVEKQKKQNTIYETQYYVEEQKKIEYHL